MKKFLFFACVLTLTLTSCGSIKKVSKKVADLAYAPEERSLNIMKITDEQSNTVLGQVTFGAPSGNFVAQTRGGSKKGGLSWTTNRLLDVSPDGTELAYVNRYNKQDNIMTRRALSQGAATQRTFRNVSSFSWGSDGKLYFADATDDEHIQIASVDSHVGNVVRQLTSGNIDMDPVLTTDGKILFFTRMDKTGPAIWSLNISTGALTLCSIGFSPTIVPGNSNQYICVRNNSAGNSEIWLVDYIHGQESVLLSDKEISFTNPSVSPDGQWIVCEGNAKSNITKSVNLDIYASKIDGTQRLQMTYHPSTDCCPVFSKDGRYVYFLSTRANKNNYYNVWRMSFMAN
ncbi:MAG: PD40 domain-containing protein [Alloprevotella sp.]|nr:PD40 domain-containing protein [Alloprevotella sp.]